MTANFDESARWLRIRSGSITIVCNFAASAMRVPLHNPELGLRVALASKEPVNVTREAVEVPAVSVAILQ
jgi:hypothetical protein